MRPRTLAWTIAFLATATPVALAHYVPPVPGTPFEGTVEVCAGEAPGFTFCSTGNHLFALDVEHRTTFFAHPQCHFVADNGCYNGVLISEIAAIPQPAFFPLTQVAVETCRVNHYAFVGGEPRNGFPHGAAHPEDHGHEISCKLSDETRLPICGLLRPLPIEPFVIRAPICRDPTDPANLAGRPVNHFCESRNLRDPDRPGGYGLWFCEIRHL